VSDPRIFALAGKRLWLAGHRGMAGSAIARRLAREACQVLTVDRRSVDLRDQKAVHGWLLEARPDAVVMAAGKVGGIAANNAYRAEFLYDNLAMAANVIHGSYVSGVKKLLYLGSTCIYPKQAAQPMQEECLLTGPLETTNEPYAIAKIAGMKLVEAYRSQYGCDFIAAMPTNLYGPCDNYHPEHAHVFAALLRRFHEAKVSGAQSVAVWGTGRPCREFLHVDDLADACVFLMQHYSGPQFFNVGTGTDLSIRDLAELIAATVGYSGAITFDATKPDGTPRKLVDVSRLRALGWSASIDLQTGVKSAYASFLEEVANGRTVSRSA